MASPEQWNKIENWAKKFLLMTDEERLDYLKKILSICKDMREQSILVFFYIYGMRPEELLRLKKEDFSIRENEFIVRLPTAKDGKDRIIHLDRNTPFIEILVKYVESCPIADWFIYKEFTVPTAFNKVLGNVEARYYKNFGEELYITPYIFRKFRISYIWAIDGASSIDILAWKGGKSIKVVEDSYTFMKPVTKFKKSIK